MTSPGERLREARLRAGYKSAAKAAQSLNIPYSTYAAHENGNSAITYANAVTYAAAFGTSADYIMSGTVTNAAVPVRGYVGAGAVVLDAYLEHAIEFVDAPPGAHPDSEAVVVRGDSMWPIYRDGDILYFSRRYFGQDIGSCVGDECIVKTRSGVYYVKEIRRGAAHWTLLSSNAQPIDDVALEWVAPVDWVRRKRRSIGR